ncbi:MAG TPA: MFS transporter [Aliiroseovarius sp.]|nr:MFS transporter [Aliiroseovarius sp.]
MSPTLPPYRSHCLTRNLSLVFIILTLVIDAMGVGVMIPVLPALIRDVTGSNLADAALWGGFLSAVFAGMQFLFGPTIGNISDRWGRRPVLLVSLFVMMLSYLVMATANTIWLLLAGRIVSGITAATYPTATAYIADISPPEKKAANFGLVGAAFGIGFVLGPVIGGILGEYGTRAPFFAAAALAGLNMTLGYFTLRETVTDAIRRSFSWRRANPLGAFRAVSSLPGARALLLFAFLNAVAGFVYAAIWPYFGEERFGWGPGMIGISLGVFGISMAAVQGGLIRLVLKRLGERRTVLVGVGFNIFAFTLMAFVTQGWIVLALSPLAAMGGLAGPALQGILSKQAPDDAQGELQGVISSLTAIATIIAPLTMTAIFAFFTGPSAPFYLPGAPFLLALAIAGISVPVFLAGCKKG